MGAICPYLKQVALLLLFFLPSYLQASQPPKVLINEIAWMGTAVSANNEWIELWNGTDSPLSLEGWALKAFDGTPEIQLEGEIPAKSFFLLERTDDNTLPGIAAGQIYAGALQNTGEKLELFNELGELIDSVDCSSGWLAGDNSTKQTMERIDSGWQTSQSPGGTPKKQNAIQQEEPQPKPEPELLPQEEAQPGLKPIVYPSGILINELIPSPEGTDALEEWIELKNADDAEVNLSQWKIQDTMGSVTTYTFPEGTKISPNGFLVLSRPTTKITLNNDGDGLLLIQPNGNILDTVKYEKAPRGQSYNRIRAAWVWSAAPTPGKENLASLPLLEQEAAEAEKEKAKDPQKQLAAVSEPISKENPLSLLVLLTALAVAFFSGTIILIIKKEIKGQKSFKNLFFR